VGGKPVARPRPGSARRSGPGRWRGDVCLAGADRLAALVTRSGGAGSVVPGASAPRSGRFAGPAYLKSRSAACQSGCHAADSAEPPSAPNSGDHPSPRDEARAAEARQASRGEAEATASPATTSATLAASGTCLLLEGEGDLAAG
jgi:hypothetical protein